MMTCIPNNEIMLAFTMIAPISLIACNDFFAADVDYTSGSGILTFAPSSDEQSVAIFTIQDAISEGTESFIVELTDVAGSTQCDETTVLISDDEAPRK